MTQRLDENGAAWDLAWTPENMLGSATDGTNDITFVYDADGMMVQRTENGQTTNRLGKLFEHNVTLGSFTKHYLFGGKLIAMREGLAANSPVSFFATDHLGSIRATLWANGSLRSRLRYDPWGKERYAQYATPTGYRYTSQRWDSDLGLYDYNARYYDPTLGKFISADTLVPQPTSPQSFNRFAYVRNNPLGFIDPTGHREIEIDGGGGGPDVRLPILTRDEAVQALKSLGKGAVTLASLLPGVGDAVDVYDFGISVSKGQWAQAGTIAGMAILPGSARALRGAGGEIVEGVARNSDEIAGGFGDIFFKNFEEGSGFSGVFDPKTGHFIIRPSGNTLLKDGTIPDGLVDQYGGHGTINQLLANQGVDSSGTVGYTVFYEGPEQLSVSWNSFSVNHANFGNRAAPMEFRQTIMDALRNSTGYNVTSR